MYKSAKRAANWFIKLYFTATQNYISPAQYYSDYALNPYSFFQNQFFL